MMLMGSKRYGLVLGLLLIFALMLAAPAGAPGVVTVSTTIGVETVQPTISVVTIQPTVVVYTLAPVTFSMTQTKGPKTGGTPVTITCSGGDFNGATQVLFGNNTVSSFTISPDGTKINTTAPASTTGGGTVEVSVPPYNVGNFTYLPVDITTIYESDDGGYLYGGNPTTIYGCGFTGATSVMFGNNPALGYTVVSDTGITATAPPSTTGEGDVNLVVTSPQGTSPPATYHYALNIVSQRCQGSGQDVLNGQDSLMTPFSGPVTGGTTVSFGDYCGDAMSGVTSVTFGSLPAASFQVVNDGQVTAVSPPVTGARAVTMHVSDPSGSLNPLTFVYEPVITSLDQTSGQSTGGKPITVTGVGFTGATGVLFGPDWGSDFNVVSDTEITVNSPPGSSGTGPVSVAVKGGQGSGFSNTVTYTYTSPPVPHISALGMTSDYVTGGSLTPMHIYGTGLSGATSVSFGNTPAPGFTVVSDSDISVTPPPSATGAGDVNIVVTTPGGTSNPETFTYVPVITSVNPTALPLSGGTVSITGGGFTGASAVVFGGTPTTGFTIVNDSTITATAPSSSSYSTLDVAVKTTYGNTNTITIHYQPVISSISPASGPLNGNTPVTITGSGFTHAMAVIFGNTPAYPTSLSDTVIKVASPSGTTAGPVLVYVRGNMPDSTTGTFTYASIPAISSISPTNGITAGGTPVVLTGSGFTGATAVEFGTVPALSFVVNSDTSIDAISPANTTGTVDIAVTTAGGTSPASSADLFTYTIPHPPTAAFTFTPSSGSSPVLVRFTDQSSVYKGTMWNWSVGDGVWYNTTVSSNPGVLYSAGTYFVSLTVTNASGSNTFTNLTPIIVSPAESGGTAPVASFTATPLAGLAPVTVRFTDTSTGSPTGWLWAFGEGNTSTSQNPSYTYSYAGNYTVNLTASTSGGSNTVTWPGYINVSAPVIITTSCSFTGVNITTAGTTQQVNISTTGNSVSGNTVTVSNPGSSWSNLSVTFTSPPQLNSGNYTGTVSSVQASIQPETVPISGVGNPNVSVSLDMTQVPGSGASITSTISSGPSPSAQSSFTLAASSAGDQINALAYSVSFTKTGIDNSANGGIISSATISMAASPAWVAANGGIPHIVILHQSDSGTTTLLTTQFVGTDASGNDLFTAVSPTGLSTFALAAVSSSSSGSSGGSRSSSGGGQSGSSHWSGSGDNGQGYTGPAEQSPAHPAVQQQPQEAPRGNTGSGAVSAQQTVAAYPATTQSGGFPYTSVALAGGSGVVLIGSGWYIRRWWIRRQNPALFRKYD
jgi:PKD repeat protein